MGKLTDLVESARYAALLLDGSVLKWKRISAPVVSFDIAKSSDYDLLAIIDIYEDEVPIIIFDAGFLIVSRGLRKFPVPS